MGFVSPSRHQHAESTNRRAFPCSPMFRPQCFPHSRRLSPPTCLVGLFHPTTAYGIRSPGVFPATELSWLIACSSPLAVSPVLPQALSPLSSVTGHGSRVCTRQRPVAGERGFSPSTARSPLEFSNSLRCLSSSLGATIAAPSARGLDLPFPACGHGGWPSAYRSTTGLFRPVPRSQNPSEFSWPSLVSSRSH
jgi:hypothetical protein